MTDQTLDQIRTLAVKFRKAIIHIRHELSIGLKNIPRGSCSDATILLGEYLKNKGFGTFNYIHGERGNKHPDHQTWSTHAWLQQGDIIVDITADQFDEVDEEVIVTRNSPWHNTFNQKIREVADLSTDHYNRKLSGQYRKIVGIADSI